VHIDIPVSQQLTATNRHGSTSRKARCVLQENVVHHVLLPAVMQVDRIGAAFFLTGFQFVHGCL
jgi:hypothetical protein